MFHARRRRLPAQATFFEDVTVELEAHKGYGAHIDCEVEYTASPDTFDESVGQGNAGEREIVAVRPFEFERWPSGAMKSTKRTYPLCPPWLEATLKDCINVNNLEPDWSEVE